MQANMPMLLGTKLNQHVTKDQVEGRLDTIANLSIKT